MRRLQTATLSDQNITAFLLASTYTADADRDVQIRVALDQVAGGGDYQAYIAIQYAGAGSFYIFPISTFTVPAGQTSIGFVSDLIPLENTDVCRVYVKGLAGDTTTPDIITRFYELTYLRPTTPGATLDVSATGEAGVDLSNIKQATAPTTLTNITVPTVTTMAWQASWDAEVQSEVADALAVYDPPTDAELDACCTAIQDAIAAGNVADRPFEDIVPMQNCHPVQPRGPD